MPQTGKYTAADIAPAQQQGAYSAADITPPQQPPDDFFGGVGRRLKSMIPDQPQTIGDALRQAPWLGPLPQALMGVARNVKQLGPQVVQQAKQAATSHQPGDILPNLNDARTAVTAASMLNPFAAGSVANVNQLQDQGRSSDAAGQGLTDAAILAAGGALSSYGPEIGQSAKILSRPVGNMAFEAAKDLPFLRGIIKGAQTFKGVGGQLNDVWNPSTPEPTPTQPPPTQPRPPQQVAVQPAATESGTWSANPRTGEQVLQSVQNMRGGGQGKVAMGVSQGAVPIPSSSRPGFGTAQTPIEESQQGVEILAQRAAKRPPVQSPVSQESPVTTPGDMTGYYGKTAGKSSLKANQRQLASPTGSTAPVPAAGPHPPNIMKILNAPGDISDSDLATVQSYFAQKRFTNMLKGSPTPFPQIGDTGVSPLGRGVGPDTIQTPQLLQTYPHLGKPIPQADPIPQQGQFAAIRTEDGQIFADPKWQQSTHVAFMKRAGIPPDKVVDSGWLIDGVYEPADRGDIAAYSERAKAALRLVGKKQAAGQ